jgi:dTDP-4-dehydrorhamnose reductase
MRLFEDHVAANVSNHCIVRASYIFGYSGESLDKRLNDSMLKLSHGDRLEFFDDMYKSPIAVGQVAEAVSSLALAEHVGAVHVAGPRMSVYEFQREALAALGADTGHVHAARMPPDSPSPRDTSLRTDLMTRLTGVAPQSISRALARC